MRPDCTEDPTIETREKLRRTVEAALDKKALDVRVLDLTGKTSFCDYFVLASGHNARHVRAVASAICDEVGRDGGEKPLGVEGMENGRWALVDLDDVIVHVFEPGSRRYYDIEGLWLDAREVPWSELGVVAERPLPSVDDDFAEQASML